MSSPFDPQDPRYSQATSYPYQGSEPYPTPQPYPTTPQAYPTQQPYPAPEQYSAQYGQEPAPARRRRGRLLTGAAAVLVLTVGGGLIGAGASTLVDHQSATGTAQGGTPVTNIANASTASIANVVKAVDPVVVSLTVNGNGQTDLGSGIVLRSDGVILTNNHVVSAAGNGGSVTVTFTDGKTANATIVAADPSEDLAVVKATGVSGLPAATLANSDSVHVGDSVVAIGNELGLPNSVSSGIVSALHRKVSVASESNSPFQRSSESSGTTYPNAIQTDASINQGDSGGALFNTAGQVIGIDSAIATADGGSSGSVGVGFAIAINDAKQFINQNLTS